MHVRRVVLQGLFSHQESAVELPERGVVLVTGPNGAGKSSLVEAVMVACWGKTLRGTEPWVGGEGAVAAYVEVGSSNLVVRRARSKDKTRLSYEVDGVSAEADTTTKLQAKLESLVGDADVWRRTSVFSSADASHFTLATDSERKRLLEAILSLDRFDDALERCRTDMRAAWREVDAAEARRSVLRERTTQLAASAERAERDLAALVVSGPVEDREKWDAAAGRLRTALSTTKAELQKFRVAAERHSRAQAEAAAKVRHLREQLGKLDAQTCYTCGQQVGVEHAARLRVEVEAAEAEAARTSQLVAAQLDALRSQAADLEAEEEDLRGSLSRAEARLAAADEAAKSVGARERLSASLAELRSGAEAARREHEESGVAVEAARRKAGALGAVEQVLGLRGVRAHLLGRALRGLEQAANGWLARVAGPGLSLRLRPYSEKKSGGISDAISLEVEGAGGGLGYRAASGGERRRLDVALLLALADVAAAARGVVPGTLLMDEVFDALDDDGVEAVCGVLRELAKDRCVLVISHSPVLAERVPAIVRLRVEGGAVRRVG